MSEDHLNLCVNDTIAAEIIRSVSDGLVVFDFRGRIMSINPAALEMLNLQWEDIREKTYAELFLGESENETFNQVLVNCIRNREESLHREVPFRRGDGRRMDLALTTSLLKSEGQGGGEGGLVLVLRDVTEFRALDRARKRVLDHLSHELKTPLAVITASLNRMAGSGKSSVIERIERNLKRLQDIQSEVEDIVRQREFRERYPFRRWLEEILDLAETLLEGAPSCGEPLREMRVRVESLFREEAAPRERQTARLGGVLLQVLRRARNQSTHRDLEFVTHVGADPEVGTDPGVLEKLLMAPLKNAIENTPDRGTISVSLEILDDMARVEIRDTGVGITEESQRQVFKGFYHARDTNYYSTKRPFDFGAGGKGLDLLRVRILSELYGVRIEWESTRCHFIPKESDLCPGHTDQCPHIRARDECARSGGTVFRLLFPIERRAGSAPPV